MRPVPEMFAAASRYRLEWLLARSVRLLARFLPMTVVRALGRALGRLVYIVNGPRRRIALENLAYAFPGRPIRERTALARAVFAHFGGLLFELIKFGTWPRERMRAAVEVEGEDRIRQAMPAAGRLQFQSF